MLLSYPRTFVATNESSIGRSNMDVRSLTLIIIIRDLNPICRPVLASEFDYCLLAGVMDNCDTHEALTYSHS